LRRRDQRLFLEDIEDAISQILDYTSGGEEAFRSSQLVQDAVVRQVEVMLMVVSKFNRYRFNNHLMIFLQRPDATVVAGFNRWKSLGRHVRKSRLRSPDTPLGPREDPWK
jgi:N-terminal domain of anti-restriction factor ArdC